MITSRADLVLSPAATLVTLPHLVQVQWVYVRLPIFICLAVFISLIPVLGIGTFFRRYAVVHAATTGVQTRLLTQLFESRIVQRVSGFTPTHLDRLIF